MNMTIQMWSIDKITPYARNARQIPPEAVDKVASSIREFSFRQPIVVDAKESSSAGTRGFWRLGSSGCARSRYTSPITSRRPRSEPIAYSDNRSHEESTWDSDLLAFELVELKDLGLDLELTGFSSDEIDELLRDDESGGGLTDEDAVPEVPETARKPDRETFGC